MSSYIETAWAWVVPAILVLLVKAARQSRKHPRYPPGPTPLPLVGNLFDFPQVHLGREFAALSAKFGDVLYLRVFGRDIIVLGSLKTARDLLDKRSANYSNRPSSVMVQLIEYDWLTVLMNYGPRWRRHRRAMHSVMSSDSVSQYEFIQLDAARRLLQNLLRSPQDLASHIRSTLAALTMETIYGIEIHGQHDEYYRMAERMSEVMATIGNPRNFPVESFPVLRHLPSWFPGGGFKQWVADAKRDTSDIADTLFSIAKHGMTRDPAKPSAVSRILGSSTFQGRQGAELETMCKEAAATMHAGADTLDPSIGAFFYAMAVHPEAQKRAQTELDAVVGPQRLPDFSDRPSLPYTNALVKEVLRWHPPGPVGSPHRVAADDEYNGYLIPGGASVFVNIWALSRDPQVYPEPEKFMPERFIDSAGSLDVGGRDPADVVFGFGRRVCPGRHFSETTLFILCASLLSAFEIGPPVGEDGIPLEVKWEATDDLIVSHPKIHKYSIKPRSPHVERLIRTTPVH